MCIVVGHCVGLFENSKPLSMYYESIYTLNMNLWMYFNYILINQKSNEYLINMSRLRCKIEVMIRSKSVYVHLDEDLEELPLE
jgi:hypothetical protein